MVCKVCSAGYGRTTKLSWQMAKCPLMVSGRLWVCICRLRAVIHKLTRPLDMMEQMASDINKIRRLLSISSASMGGCSSQVQVTSCKRSLEVGFTLQIRHQTTTSHVKSIKMELLCGSSKETSLLSGTRRVPCCGYVENVRC
jgi:hypothetical protein